MCRSAVLNPNEKIDIVIRPEDLEITTVDKGKVKRNSRYTIIPWCSL